MSEPTRIASSTARERFGDVLDRVALRGERFVITKHGGREVALVPVYLLDDVATLEAKLAELLRAWHESGMAFGHPVVTEILAWTAERQRG